MENQEKQDPGDSIQLHLVLPYKQPPREDSRIKTYLDRGFRIVQLQRITDREVIVTLAPAGLESEVSPAPG